jgi:hypothetical protein
VLQRNLRGGDHNLVDDEFPHNNLDDDSPHTLDDDVWSLVNTQDGSG